MRIICVDNYDREGPRYNDRHIVFVRDEERAHRIAGLLNEEDDDSVLYKVAPNDYKLKVFEP